MANGYMPRADVAALRWMQVFAGGLVDHPGRYPVTPQEAADLAQVVAAFAEAYQEAISSRTRTRAAVAAKDRLRSIAEEARRPLYARIKSDPGVTTKDKILIGVRPINSSRSRIHAPDEAPLLRLARLAFSGHVLTYANPAAPSRRHKAAGATQLQLFFRSADKPAGPLRFLGCFTRNPMRVDHSMADNGRIVIYQARWMTRRGETGPWSNPLHVPVATISRAARPTAA